MHKAKLFSSNLADDVARKMDVASEGIIKEINTLESGFKDISTKVDMSTRKLNNMISDARNPLKHYPGLDDNIVNQREYLETLVIKQNNVGTDLKILRDLNKGIGISPQSIVSKLEASPDIASKFTSLIRWQRVANRQMARKNQILESVSRNLGNDRKFVKEYLKEVAALPEGNLYRMTWLANTKNQAKLLQLQTSKRYMAKLLGAGAGGKGAKESIKGLSATEAAKKLGIGTMGVAAVGAVAFYSWFDDKGDKIVEDISNIKARLDTINTTGLGTVIVDDVKDAIEKIQKIKSKTESGLGTNPAKAVQEFIREFTEAQQVINNALSRWSAVVQTSNNPDEARKVGKALQQYNINTIKSLKELDTSLSSKLTKPMPGMVGEKPVVSRISQTNILAIQRYLQETNPSVGASGGLDKPTIRALKQLEREYNRIGSTDRFTNLLINRSARHMINLDDLRELKTMMKKYK